MLLAYKARWKLSEVLYTNKAKNLKKLLDLLLSFKIIDFLFTDY